MKCPKCKGAKIVQEARTEVSTGMEYSLQVVCGRCRGKGTVGAVLPDEEAPAPVAPVAIDLAANVPTPDELREANRRTAKATGFNHPMLKHKLYQTCPACDGTRKTRYPAMVDGVPKTGGGLYSGPLPVGSDCVLCTGDFPEFIDTGLTVGQAERIHAERDALLAVVVYAERTCGFQAQTGNGLEPVALSALMDTVREVLARVSPSEVTRARNELKLVEQKPHAPKPT